MNQKPLTDEFIEKTIREVRNNIARREREAFSKGIIWTVLVTWFGMAIVYAIGNTPNPGIMVGTLVVGLWYRYGKENK